jgi:DNA-binding NarL/FixJ family response regulator
MKWLIENSEDLRVSGSVATLGAVHDLMYPGTARVAAGLAALSARSSEESVSARLAFGSGATPMAEAVDAIVVDKGLGLAEVMEFLRGHTANSQGTPVVVWGAISESEALKLLQAGAKGILRRTSESGTLLTCLRAVTSGGTWMEDGIFGSTEKLFNPRRSQLTQREKEVVGLVEKGLRNRDIAEKLGIQTGTVKIHLKHIFEKTGVRGRYGLAFTGLQNKGSIMVAPQQFTA